MDKVADLISRSLSAYSSGDYDTARQLCLQVLAIHPDNISALLNLGNICYLCEDYLGAAEKYRRVLQISPNDMTALVNLADASVQNADWDKAVSLSKQILSEDPCSKDAYRILGSAYAAQQKYADSVAAFQEALKLDTADDWLCNSLSQSCQQMGDYPAALDYAWQAVELSGGLEAHHINFAYALYEIALEKGTGFVSFWQRRWERKYGRDAIVSYTSQALTSGGRCRRAPSFYVRQIFDVFAESFEDSLRELDYAVPMQIAAAAAAVLPSDSLSRTNILDLGCGTGWCAEKLRSLYPSAEFIGVDLSPAMLAEAAKKNIYSQLVEDDIEHWLSSRKNAFDLIVAADVFTYFGDLKKIIKFCATALHSNGVLIFSATCARADSEDYLLHLSGRFHHGRFYLRRLLKKYGFRIKKMPLVTLRREAGEDVSGWIVTAVKA